MEREKRLKSSEADKAKEQISQLKIEREHNHEETRRLLSIIINLRKENLEAVRRKTEDIQFQPEEKVISKDCLEADKLANKTDTTDDCISSDQCDDDSFKECEDRTVTENDRGSIQSAALDGNQSPLDFKGNEKTFPKEITSDDLIKLLHLLIIDPTIEAKVLQRFSDEEIVNYPWRWYRFLERESMPLCKGFKYYMIPVEIMLIQFNNKNYGTRVDQFDINKIPFPFFLSEEVSYQLHQIRQVDLGGRWFAYLCVLITADDKDHRLHCHNKSCPLLSALEQALWLLDVFDSKEAGKWIRRRDYQTQTTAGYETDYYRKTKEHRKGNYYETNNKKGYLLVLNFRDRREGTDEDVKKIKQFFTKCLKFDMDDPRSEAQADLSTNELMDCLEKTQTKLNTSKEYYCFTCIILSHGNEDGICTGDGQKSVDEIIKMFDSDEIPNFAGKPKLFFIQACRGENKNRGVKVHAVDNMKEDKVKEEVEVRIPHEADILAAYATTHGKVAVRAPAEGSWFISEMMKVFENNYKTDHVEDMLITVRQNIAKSTAEDLQTMQMPCVQTTLTKRLILE